MKIKLPSFISSSINKGFTLIELLVVLGIIGILAAALLAAINPVEQLKKAQDAGLKEAATEFVSGNVSYYSTHNALPWFTAANGGANCYSGGATMSSIALSSLSACITSLISTGDLKASFSNSSDLSKIVVTDPNPQTGNATDIVACFQPQSNAEQADVDTKYTQTGAIATGCKSQGGATACYWCAQ